MALAWTMAGFGVTLLEASSGPWTVTVPARRVDRTTRRLLDLDDVRAAVCVRLEAGDHTTPQAAIEVGNIASLKVQIDGEAPDDARLIKAAMPLNSTIVSVLDDLKSRGWVASPHGKARWYYVTAEGLGFLDRRIDKSDAQQAAAAVAPAAANGARAKGAKAPKPVAETVPLLPNETTLAAQLSGLAVGAGGSRGSGGGGDAGPSKLGTLEDFFFGHRALRVQGAPETPQRGQHLVDAGHRAPASGAFGLLGWLPTLPEEGAETSDADEDAAAQSVYLSVGDPFCLVAIGVQGAGKSHSLNVVVENCLLHCPPYLQAAAPLTTVVFHYDQDPLNFCEAVSLSGCNPRVQASVQGVDETVVLVSPSFFESRRSYYADQKTVNVFPLLFRWNDLSAGFIKSLMRVEEDDAMPLYMSAILNMLRKMQKAGRKPTLAGFRQEIENMDLMKTQTSGLNQRLDLLESLVYESAENEPFKRLNYPDVDTILRRASSGTKRRLVVVDLTDRMLSGQEANGIFEVVLSMFLAIPVTNKVGKLVVFDEAHKYVQPTSSDPLSQKIVSIVRQMRHHGIRVAISTQSPKAIPAELLELCSITLLHHFHSREWFSYLQTKIPLPEPLFDHIMALETGRALVYARRWPAALPPNVPVAATTYIRQVVIRPRITVDAGVSKVHDATVPASSKV